MIPEFPKFKKLEFDDKKDVEKFTSKFPPYSDFNFVSMWSWNIKGEMGFSLLNNNLVVKFNDYLNERPFFSFLGYNMVEETAESLMDLLKKEGHKPKLKLIPEEVANKLSKQKFDSELDENAFDYIYSVSHLANMHNWSRNTSGKNVRNYRKSCPHYIVKHVPIKEARKEDYVEMFKKWAKHKGIGDYASLNEYKALERILEVNLSTLKAVSIFVDNVLVGFTIYEILSPEYAISHFAKSDPKHHCAIGDVLNWEEAKILNEKGIKYFNWEQDLGIPGLRKSKQKYKPVFFLKKLRVIQKDHTKT